MTNQTQIQLRTIGQIAQATGQPIHKIRYLIDRLRLEPVSRAGSYRLFDENQVETIRLALARRQVHTHSLRVEVHQG